MLKPAPATCSHSDPYCGSSSGIGLSDPPPNARRPGAALNGFTFLRSPYPDVHAISSHGVGAIPKAQRWPSAETSLSTKNRSLVAKRCTNACAFGVTLTPFNFGSSSVHPCRPKRASDGSPSAPSKSPSVSSNVRFSRMMKNTCLSGGSFVSGVSAALLLLNTAAVSAAKPPSSEGSEITERLPSSSSPTYFLLPPFGPAPLPLLFTT